MEPQYDNALFIKKLRKKVLAKELCKVQEKQMQGCASGTEQAGALTGCARALQKSN